MHAACSAYLSLARPKEQERVADVVDDTRFVELQVEPAAGPNLAQSRRRCGSSEPSPGADVAGVSPVPAQMWQRVEAVPAQMWQRVEPSPGADVAES